MSNQKKLTHAENKTMNNTTDAVEALTFEQGYVCAVATMLSQHGDSVCAKDMLGCMGNIDWSKIDEYDRDIIKEYGLLPNAPASRVPTPLPCSPWIGDLYHSTTMYDGWGCIRDQSGRCIMTISLPTHEDEILNVHRRNKTDPTQPIVDEILRRINYVNAGVRFHF